MDKLPKYNVGQLLRIRQRPENGKWGIARKIVILYDEICYEMQITSPSKVVGKIQIVPESQLVLSQTEQRKRDKSYNYSLLKKQLMKLQLCLKPQ